jgi:protein-tyrosine phosphatase
MRPMALNFRDVGGLPAADGVTRAGVLFRSANLARLTTGRARSALSACAASSTCAPTTRSRRAESRRGSRARDVRVPLFLGSVASFFDRDVTLAELYRSLIDDAGDRASSRRRAPCWPRSPRSCTAPSARTARASSLRSCSRRWASSATRRRRLCAHRIELLPPSAMRGPRYLRRVHPDARNLEELATRSPAEVMRALLAEVRAPRVGGGLPRAHGLAEASSRTRDASARRTEVRLA